MLSFGRWLSLFLCFVILRPSASDFSLSMPFYCGAVTRYHTCLTVVITPYAARLWHSYMQPLELAEGHDHLIMVLFRSHTVVVVVTHNLVIVLTQNCYQAHTHKWLGVTLPGQGVKASFSGVLTGYCSPSVVGLAHPYLCQGQRSQRAKEPDSMAQLQGLCPEYMVGPEIELLARQLHCRYSRPLSCFPIPFSFYFAIVFWRAQDLNFYKMHLFFSFLFFGRKQSSRHTHIQMSSETIPGIGDHVLPGTEQDPSCKACVESFELTLRPFNIFLLWLMIFCYT